jgi:hypothetical protein
MKKILALSTVIVLSVMIVSVFGQGNPASDVTDGNPAVMVKDINPSTPGGLRDALITIYDNGPVVTASGVGYNGFDVSQLQAIALGMGTYGWTASMSVPYWVGDDFTVPSGGWNITGFSSLAYQTGSTSSSTFTDMFIMIYDGAPWAGGNVIFGDGTTNRLTNTGFSGIYRILDNNYTDNNRPIMENYAAFSLHLDPETYWVIWTYIGSTSYGGPFVPPITILGQNTTGNGIQSDPAGGWVSVVDGGTATPQGFPFKLYGDEIPIVPLSGWALVIGIGLIAAVVLVRYKKLI